MNLTPLDVLEEDATEQAERIADLLPATVFERWTDSDGTRNEDFEASRALAYLLLKDVVGLNSRWWHSHDKDNISVFVICNDVFAWGCADAEDLPHREIQALYERVIKDPVWGAAKWCIERRGRWPQKPVEAAIRKAGLWDVDETRLLIDHRGHPVAPAALSAPSHQPSETAPPDVPVATLNKDIS